MRVLKVTLCAIACMLAGCAGVTVHRLTPDLSSKAGPSGMVYYLPAPYLLVAELPPSATPGQGATTQGGVTNPPPQQNPAEGGTLPAPAAPPKPAGKGGHGPAFKVPEGPAGAASPAAAPSPTANGTAPPASTSDTSFGGNTPQYVMKLVYLPDETRPMSMNESTGLFGTYSAKPALQDGWMLTSLDASADSKVAETLTALGSLAGTVAGAMVGGAPAAAKSKPGANPLLAEQQPKVPLDLAGFFSPGHYILRPGLYKFNYDKGGTLTDLTPVTYFTGCGAIKATDLAALALAESGARSDCNTP